MKSEIQSILTEGRSNIEVEVQEITQNILDEYGSGIQITQVQTQKRIHQAVIDGSEMFKLLEQIEKDLKMKLKRMLMMLSQEFEVTPKKYFKKQKHIRKK